MTVETHIAPAQPGGTPRLSLAPGEVGVWVGHLEVAAPMASWSALLAQEERDRAGRFRLEADRERHIYGRGLLRELAAAYLGCLPGALEFVYTANGKPELTRLPGQRRLGFNLSHSGNRLLLAFAWDREVGVDVELLRTDVEIRQIAERFFSQHEQQTLLSLGKNEQIPAFFRCWTRKEAYVKAVGEGLSLPLSQFDVTLRPGEPARLLATRPDLREASRWALWNLDLGADYAAALAVPTEELSCERSLTKGD